jgi:hypothetical protein
MFFHSATTLRARHTIAISVAFALVLATVLGWLVSVLPLGTNNAHALSHLAVTIPALLLLTMAIRTWPPPAVRAEVLSRGVLLLGLGMVAGGMLLEAVGAYGYEEAGRRQIEVLTAVHNFAVPFGGIGLLMVVIGGVLSTGVRLAARRGIMKPEHLYGAVVTVLLTVVAYFGAVFTFDL